MPRSLTEDIVNVNTELNVDMNMTCSAKYCILDCQCIVSIVSAVFQLTGLNKLAAAAC